MNNLKSRLLSLILSSILLITCILSIISLNNKTLVLAEEKDFEMRPSGIAADEFSIGKQFKNWNENDSKYDLTESLKEKDYTKHYLSSTYNSLKITSSLQDIMSSILSEEPFTINGEINDGAINETLDSYYDFSEVSKYEIAQWLYENNVISEEQKIDIFCKLLDQRNFDNIYCLEEVMDEIRYYQKKADQDLVEKIDSLSVSLDFEKEFSTRAITSTVSSSNFIIHYDPSHANSDLANAVALYFEQVREQYIKNGFKKPILETGSSKYNVYLDPNPDEDSSTLASTFKREINGNVCASYIYIYNFSEMNDKVRETIAHEYFHAIQNAYNHQSGWFKEACANWGSIAIGRKLGVGYPNTTGWIKRFLNSYGGVSLSDTSGYPAVLLPLTIDLKYGGESAICSIYESYSKYGAKSLFDYNSLIELRASVTEGINKNGYSSGSFDDAFKCMTTYILNPNEWYNAVADTSDWKSVGFNEMWNLSSGSTYSYSGNIVHLASRYCRVFVPSNYNGTVKVSVDFSSPNSSVQAYTVDKNGYSVVTFHDDYNKFLYLEKPDIGGDIRELVFVISNLESSTDRLNNSNGVSYDVRVELVNNEENIVFSNNTRLEQRLCYIPKGEYQEYKITFADFGNKIIQTFGQIDTKLEIYSSDGVLLAQDDDSGYSLNSFVNFVAQTNTSYTIRLKYYNSGKSGETQLVINSAYGPLELSVSSLSKYEDIFSMGLQHFILRNQQYRSKILTFVSSSVQAYTFELESEFDNFIYVMDPRYAKAPIKDIDFNDDGGTNFNARLIKTVEKNVPYFIVCSAYNPSNSNTTADLDFSISKHDHIFNSITCLQNYAHRMTCDCGVYYDENHNYNNCIPYDENTHRNTCVCGNYQSDVHQWYNLGNGEVVCLICKYRK